jgi:hypothetical protein
MRTAAPHPLIRYRHALLLLALLALAVAWVAISVLAASHPSRAPIGALSGVIFVWANGLYWLVVLRYPYVEGEPGHYYSYDERKQWDSRVFLALYFMGAVLASIACVKVGLAG